MKPNDGGEAKPETQSGEALMASLLASSTECAIIGQDLDGKILFWNEGAKKLYGYNSDGPSSERAWTEPAGKGSRFTLLLPEMIAADVLSRQAHA